MKAETALKQIQKEAQFLGLGVMETLQLPLNCMRNIQGLRLAEGLTQQLSFKPN